MLEIDRSLTDFNFYYAILLGYLQQNIYVVDPEHPQLTANTLLALDTFEQARRNGASVSMAEEEAFTALFSNIGESEYDLVSDLILENFGDTVDLDTNVAVEYWTNQVMTEIPDLFDGFDRLSIGVDALERDHKETELVGKIVIYLSDHGLQ